MYGILNVRHWDRIVEAWSHDDDQALDDGGSVPWIARVAARRSVQASASWVAGPFAAERSHTVRLQGHRGQENLPDSVACLG